ncbi:hypothetical protein ACP4J3_40365, partial [Streptomyces sp. UG1]
TSWPSPPSPAASSATADSPNETTSKKYKRVHALTYADLGDSLAAQARADEAVAAWSQALTLMEGMTSDRTRKAITSLRSTLSIYHRRKVPGATELARRTREALA